MVLVQAFIRFLIAVTLFVTPIAAGATSAHDLVQGKQAGLAAATTTSHDGCDETASDGQSVAAGGQSGTSNAPIKSEKDKHCGSCCLSACAKHLIGLPETSVQIWPSVHARVAAFAAPQLRGGLDPDPARKPPRS